MKKWCLIFSFLMSGAVVCFSQGHNRYPLRLQEVYKNVNADLSKNRVEKPLIGISASTVTKSNNGAGVTYIQSIIRGGGIPCIIPVTSDFAILDDMLSGLDGILFTGGEDFDPAFYGEARHEFLGEVNDDRDIYDIALFRMAILRNLPILGICRGLQLINVGLGGTLIQDIPSQRDTVILHGQYEDSTKPAHNISIVHGSILEQLLGTSFTGVNSRHHQAIKDVAPGMKITAWCPEDSIPEAFESDDGNILGVQFHPEIFTYYNNDSCMLQVFKYLIKKAYVYKEAKDIQGKVMQDINISNRLNPVKVIGKPVSYSAKEIRRMNKTNTLVILSPNNENEFWLALNKSKDPVICTHMASKNIFNHPHNLSDEQLQSLSKKGGLVILYPEKDILGGELDDVSIDTFINHLEHCIKVAGMDHVGIGYDSDSKNSVVGIEDTNDLILITQRLLEKGYNREDIYKLWIGNKDYIYNIITSN